MDNRSVIKRDTLIRNLQRAINRSQDVFLPATIREVYAFGGILRDKKRAHDFDLVITYEQTDKQKASWEWFKRCFGDLHDEIGKEFDTRKIREYLHSVLNPYFKQEISLRKAVEIEAVYNVFKENGVEPSWAGCFSWTEVFYNPFGFFVPDLSKVLRSILCRGMRGLQVFFCDYKDYKDGKPGLVAKNFRLAWSAEKKDIKKNLEMSIDEKNAYILKELELFSKQLLELKTKYISVISELNLKIESYNLKIHIKKLISRHVDFHYNSNDSYDVLLAKCEFARNEIRECHQEIRVLQSLINNILSLENRIDEEFYQKYSLEEWITYWTIMNIPKKEVREIKIREILSYIGLPENHVITIRSFGTRTSYELEPDIIKRKELINEAKEEQIRSHYLRSLNKLIKSYDKSYYPRLELKNQKPDLMIIHYSKSYESVDEDILISEIEKLKQLGFEIHQKKYTRLNFIRAYKKINLTGIEDIKQLEKIIKNALE